MQRKGSRTRPIVAGVAFAGALATAAWARGGYHRGRGFDPGTDLSGRPGPCSGRLVDRLVFPCRAGCSDAARSCVDAADAAAVTCATGSCGAELSAAQTACQADRESTACSTALDTLKTCAQTCIDTQRTAVTACRDTASSCLAACGSS